MRLDFGKLSWTSLAAMLALVALGTVAIWSAGSAREAAFHGMWRANLMTAGFGFLAYCFLAAVDYRALLDWASVPGYALSLILLVAVLIFGATVYGGKRWLWFFQPSELAKLGVLCFLAQFAPRLRGFRGFCLAALAVGIPILLILAEPDLGTALTLVPAVLVMLLVAGVWRRGLVTICAVLGMAALALFVAVHEAEKPGADPARREAILRYVPLRPHQVKRVKVFLFPDEDRNGAGYNLRQAKISIGSGGLTGKGLGKAETNALRYLPPSVSMNDFIFCVYAEELGYLGSLALLALYALVVFPCIWVARQATDERGRLLALGVATLFFAHVYINIAMSIGLVPITGLPLPFVSAGRTFLVTVMASLGLVQSVSLHRKESE